MDNQKEKRGSAENRDTRNLSELLEFDFDSVNEEVPEKTETEKKASSREDDQYMKSFFEDDMGLPPLPESQKDKKAESVMSDTFSRVKAAENASKSQSAVTSPKVRKEKPAQEPTGRRVWGIVKGVLVWSKEILVALLLVWLILTFVAQNSTVYGSSMEPTLKNGEMIIVNKFIYRFTAPERGDIIVFEHQKPDGGTELMIKRIIGLPGDTIELIDEMVYVNGEVYDESKYLEGKTTRTGNIDGPFVVPENSYFVMGDNREVSKDSRYDEVGAVSMDQIIGKASLRFWPLDRLAILQ